MKKQVLSLGLAVFMACGGSCVVFASESTNHIQSSVEISESLEQRISEWCPNSKYEVGIQVVYEGKIYECTVAHSRLKPTTKYVWTCLGEYKEYPNWVRGKKYVVGDKIYYEDHIYECIVDHSRLKPTTKYVWKLLK